MKLYYNFYNPETHRDENYEWDCSDNDDVFKELVNYYVEMYGIEYDTAWNITVDDDQLRERIFDEISTRLHGMFETKAKECFLEEVVYSL